MNAAAMKTSLSRCQKPNKAVHLRGYEKLLAVLFLSAISLRHHLSQNDMVVGQRLKVVLISTLYDRMISNELSGICSTTFSSLPIISMETTHHQLLNTRARQSSKWLHRANFIAFMETTCAAESNAQNISPDISRTL